MNLNNEVNWNEPTLQRWLNTISKKSTKNSYKTAYRAYAKFTKKSPSLLIDEAIADSKLDARQKTDIVKSNLLNFYQYLVNDYSVKSRGKGEHEEVRRGVRSKTAHAWVNSIRSFYGTFDVYIKLKGRSSLPPARVENKRLDLTTMDIKSLVDHARNPRDKAIILTMFQSGMDVSTLCSLKFKDIAEGIKNDELPLKIETFREKAGVDYYTFLGKDSVNAIKAYMRDLKSRGFEPTANDPLFLKLKRKRKIIKGKDKIKDKEIFVIKGIETHLIQKILRETAVRSGLVDENQNGNDFSPVSPHALREAFGSIMINKGVPDSIVDFWLGHTIGEMSLAYKRQRFEDVKEMYSKNEKFISIEEQGNEAIALIKRETEEKTQKLRENFDNLYSENIDLRKEMDLLKEKTEKSMDWMLKEIRGFQRETLERMGDSPQVIEETMKKAGSKKEDYR